MLTNGQRQRHHLALRYTRRLACHRHTPFDGSHPMSCTWIKFCLDRVIPVGEKISVRTPLLKCQYLNIRYANPSCPKVCICDASDRALMMH